ncbi:MAG TPA: HDOD domain-containing protein [Terriglobales bacterium]|nr:HDOD domain-containing protein [Terriglobales bacterium]
MPAATATANVIVEKLESTRDLPTVPAVLLPLLKHMEKPLEQVDIHQVVELISQDKSLAGRCLQVANSPLFGVRREVETIQSAVVTLGLERVQQIAVSCSLLKLMPAISVGVNPSVFWAHSLACAMVARELANKIGFADSAKAYAAGLLHDIGIVAVLWVAPHEFRRTYEEARNNRIPLHEAEDRVLGITHCESGKIIARTWNLPLEIVQVVAGHHAPSTLHGDHALASIVGLSDVLCRFGGLGYGYLEDKQTSVTEDPAFGRLAMRFPALRPFDLARFTGEMQTILDEIRLLISRIYGSY